MKYIKHIILCLILSVFFINIHQVFASNLITDVHSNGSQTVYNATTSSDVGNGMALLVAVSQAQSGDSLYLASSTFDLASSTIDASLGGTGYINIHGAGEYSTIIESSYGNISAITPIISIATNAQTTDLSIIVTGSSTAYYAAGWGTLINSTSFTNALLQNVYISGFTDGIYFRNTTSGGVGSATVRNVTVSTTWDTLVWQNYIPGGILNIFNSNFTTTGTNPLGSHSFAHCIYLFSTNTNIYNSTCNASGGNSQDWGVYLSTGGSNFATTTVQGGSITVSGLGGAPKALNNGNSVNGVIQVTPDLLYDNTKTTGTITSISPFLPILQVYSSSTPSVTSAVLNATLLTDGGATSTVEGFNYGTTTNYGSSVSTVGSFIYNDFSQTISNLTCNTTYHYQGFAVSSAGTGTTTDQTFVTGACPVIIPQSSTPVQSISYSSSGGSVSNSVLASILTPSPATTAYLASRGITVPPQVSTSMLIPQKSNGTSTFIFTRNLSLGQRGNDVQALQQYLNSNGFTVAVSGPGSLGNETMYFGIATKKELIRFQIAHNITPASGYFGPITRGFIK